MPSKSVTPWYLDKGLYAMALGVLVPLLNSALKLNLDDAKIGEILFVVASYIAAHKFKSAKVLIAEIEHDAIAAVSSGYVTNAQAAWSTQAQAQTAAIQGGVKP